MERAEGPALGAEYQNNTDEAYFWTLNLSQEWEAFVSEFSPLNSSTSNSAGLAETGNDFEREQVIDEMDVPPPDFWNELEFLSEAAMEGQLEAFPSPNKAGCPIYASTAANLTGDLATPTKLVGVSDELIPGDDLMQHPIPLEVEAQIGENSLSISTTDAPTDCPQDNGTVKNGGRVRPSSGAGEHRYQCPSCPKSFSHPASRIRHVLLKHSNHNRPKCPTCKKSFSQPTYLRWHMMTHTGNHPCKCPTCDRGFVSASKLKVHMNTHKGLRPFKCPHCPRDFTQSGTLNRHVRSLHVRQEP